MAEERLGVGLIGKRSVLHPGLVRCPVHLALHFFRVALEESHSVHHLVRAPVVGLASDRLLVRRLCLVQLIQHGIPLYQIGVSSGVIGIKPETFSSFFLCFLIFSEHSVGIPQVQVRFGVSRVGLSPQLADLVTLLDLSGDAVVVLGGDVVLFRAR